MYRLNLFRFLFCAFAAFAVALSASAQTQAGAVKAARVTGEVLKLSKDGTTASIKDGQLLTETDTVITRGSATVVLVFANGSSISLAENSRLAIEEFKMDPLAGDINVAKLSGEPSVSKTRLNLAYGEMVGNVKKLNAASVYDVQTPVGAAGIRGTTFRIVLRFDAQGKASFSLATSEGLVNFTASGTVQVTSGTGEAAVPAGTEVTATVTVDPTSGAITNIAVSTPSTISATAAAAITSAVTTAVEATATVTITQTEQSNQQQQQQQNQQQQQQNQQNQQQQNQQTNQPNTDVISPT
ncbi:MAG: FecR domain-containing protein [Candidatus Didemnitutus sp.]|nr:FecR domain-containing protein [Candidatus Didemnitutus sp.]